ncbi:MAG: flavin reductase family protein [Acidimicrobiia bacterium]|nr:flavin reductase family protein [Acidimicrobiia bacterium]MDH3398197.1 flavin reductase family protein [Acidimicrobiia bacterium]MDH5616952.1 flavin reductase family protein [Acidimicrobiia bacterium]
MSGGWIHEDHPFATPPDLRDPARQLRGRLASGITVLTSGGPDNRTGLTVSSLLMAEGEPSRVVALVGEATDLWFAIQQSGAWVLHVLGADDRQLSDRFAGLRPSPGGLFAGLDVEDTPWGPTMSTLGTRAYCRLERSVETGFHRLVTGQIDQIDLVGRADPLVYYRGRYRILGDEPISTSGTNPSRSS